jgi:hypothetical protein
VKREECRHCVACLEASDPTKGSQRGAYRSTVEKLAKVLKVKPYDLYEGGE